VNDEPEMLGKLETLRTIAHGLLPWAGDWYDFADGLALMWDGLWRWLHLLLRLVMMAAFPITLVLLYPIVRMAQRDSLARRKKVRAEWLAEMTRRAE
jgi:hypothetical protein